MAEGEGADFFVAFGCTLIFCCVFLTSFGVGGVLSAIRDCSKLFSMLGGKGRRGSGLKRSNHISDNRTIE